MRTPHRHIAWFFVLIAMVLCIGTLSAQTIDFTFDTKDYDGQVMPLTERLDSEKNYLILFSAFWCQPCVKQLDDVFSKNIELYRDVYNLEIIILNNDYYNSTNVALNKIKEKQWYFQQYFTDDLFSGLGVYSIPRDYLLPAGETSGERVYASNFLQELEEYYLTEGYESLLFDEHRQQVAGSSCNTEIVKYGGSEITEIGNNKYHQVGGQYYRTGVQNLNVYRYDVLSETDELVFDYYVDVCDQFTLKDAEGDVVDIVVESRIVTYDEVIIETDQMIVNDCGEEVAFVLSSKYGSNAGLVFDIHDGSIVSRLICQLTNGVTTYFDEALGSLCEPVSTSEVAIPDMRLTNNPGNGVFEIINGASRTVQIYDINGRLIDLQRTNNLIDISSEPDGIYMVVPNLKHATSPSTYYIKQ